MGLGIDAGSETKPGRWTLFNKHYLGKINPALAPPYDAVIVDVPSEARRMGSGPRPRSATMLCAEMCKPLFRRTKRLAVFLFDQHERMHSERKTLHAKRYKPLSEEKQQEARSKGKIIVEGQAYQPGKEPYSNDKILKFTTESEIDWSRMWPSQAGKKKAFELISKCLVTTHHQHASDDREMIMWYKGEPVAWPYCKTNDLRPVIDALKKKTGGEADSLGQMAVEIVASHGYTEILQQTVDTDMLCQNLCQKTYDGVTIKPLQLKNELVDVQAVRRMYGPSPSSRASAAFWIIACGGCDYCKGFRQFGYLTKDLIQLAMAKTPAVMVCKGNVVGLKTKDILAALSSIKRQKRKGVTVGQFNEEMRCIAFCIALFSGACSERLPCGGPDKPTEDAITHFSPEEAYSETLIDSVLRNKFYSDLMHSEV